MPSGEKHFIDANILVYAAIKDDVRHTACRDLLIGTTGATLCFSPQILAEFYSIVTSPKRVTTPFTPAQAIEFVEILLEYDHVVLLPISTEVTAQWLSLLKQRKIRGPHVFDLQIAATMIAHSVLKLVTYNGSDFQNVGIEIQEPAPAMDPQ